MISILFNWIYIFITTFMTGFLFTKFITQKLHYKILHISNILLCGIIIATVYAQLFSLIYKIGFLANVLLLLVCVAAFLFWHDEVLALLTDALKKNGLTRTILQLGLILVWSYFTSRGHIHYDSDLYHAQSIRWLEEYGIVKGLGNIHVRFAYNSSFFALSALYSMKFLLKQSLHTVNGFIALLLSFEVLKLIDIVRRKKRMLSDFARIGAFLYLTRIYDEFISPASDYATMYIVFIIVINWLLLLETDMKSTVPFALLCIAGTYAVSLKLTAGLILLLTLKPAYQLIKKKLWKEIIFYFLLGFVILTPWMIRTAIISGYLLYPFPELDVLHVDWKISSELAAADAAEIKTWGRGLKNAALVDLPISEWFCSWFHTTLPAPGKLIIAADILCMPLFAAMIVHSVKNRSRAVICIQPDQLLVLGTVVASYIYWQLSAPLLRYGYAYVLLVVMLTAGIIKERLSESAFIQNHVKIRLLLQKTFHVSLFALVAAMLVFAANYMYRLRSMPYYVSQADYGTYALCSYEINGVTFYYPESGDRVGYNAFPAIPRKLSITFRGDGLQDGFTGNHKNE